MAQNALRSGFFLNGGAALAVLAYIGQHGGNDTRQLSYGLLFFAIGTLFITASTALGYFAQSAIYEDKEKKWCDRLNNCSIVIGLSSLALFVIGMGIVFFTFQK
jgi:hypothetical protein